MVVDDVLVVDDDDDDDDDVVEIIASPPVAASSAAKRKQGASEGEAAAEADDDGLVIVDEPEPSGEHTSKRVRTEAPVPAACSAGAAPGGANRKARRIDCSVCSKSHQRRGAMEFERCGHGAGIECLREQLAALDAQTGALALCPAPSCGQILSCSDFLLVVGPERYAEVAKAQSELCRVAATPPKNKKGRRGTHAAAALAEAPPHAVEVAALTAVLDKLGSLYTGLVSSSISRKRSKKASPKKSATAWSKGVGFGGTEGTMKTANAQVKKATARQLEGDEAVTAAFSSLLAALPPPASSPEHLLAVQYALHTSSFESLLALLLRNDSLLDITTSRAELYAATARVVARLAESSLFVGLLEDGCPIRHAIKLSTDTSAGSKRKAVSVSTSDANEESVSTSVHELLRTMARQCKVFVRQCKGGPEKLVEADPLGVVSQLRQLSETIQATVSKLPPHVRGTMGRSSAASSAVAADCDSGPSSATSPEEQDYIQSMKALQFRMVRIDHATHTYSNDIRSSAMSCTKRDRIRRITREMASLSTSLPLTYTSSIFVRVDESRPDVLKVLIIGPEGTPYANGCFCFDVFLPPEYPEKPPKVSLLTTSRGRVRFNPNLYASGKVCLSLLGTWSGPGWDAKTSTLLQVFLSIQSLILVDEPYFNEPGYESRPSARAECEEYNQSLQYHTMSVAMLEMLKESPPEFSGVLLTHFRLKRAKIVEQCESWLSSAKDTMAKKATFGNYYSSEHHQLPFISRSNFARMVDQVRTYLDTLEVEDSITIV